VPIELVFLSVLRALVEVAGVFLLGQGLLYLLAGSTRDRNAVYRMFQFLTRPVIRVTRAITPRVVVDRHIPLLTFFLLFWLWIVLQIVKLRFCAAHQLVCV
jgi:hypothetical protein